LISSKTDGNAFFVNQMFKSLAEERLLSFDFENRRWQWKIEELKAMGITDNVVELMASKVQKLPIAMQDVLTMAACIGNRFDLKTLSIVNEKSPAVTVNDLKESIRDGLIIQISDFETGLSFSSDGTGEDQFFNPSFMFLHDRIQQAAYSLIADDRKKEVHLNIGHLLLSNLTENEINERIFDILSHLNFSRDLITNQTERNKLAELNLLCSRKAKTSAAYEPALNYVKIGMEFLDKGCWEDSYETTFNLYKQRIEVEYLNVNFEQSEKFINQTLVQAKTAVEKAEIYDLLVVQYTMMAKYPETYEAGRKALLLLGIAIPESDHKDLKAALDTELAKVKENLGDKTIASLVDATELNIPEKQMAVKLLSNMLPPAFFLSQELFGMVVTKSVNICLKYGISPESTYSFSCLGLFLVGLGDYKNGYEFGLLGIRMAERFNDMTQKCRSHNILLITYNSGKSISNGLTPLIEKDFRQVCSLETLCLRVTVAAKI